MTARSSATTQLPSNVDYTKFTVKEWASLLSQTNNPSFFNGKGADIIGFVSPAEGNADVFYVSRFVLTCCAVDARPIGVGVYHPHWESVYRKDQWVHVTGTFMQSSNGEPPVNVVKPTNILKIREPDNPYAY
jgi:uncharacterized repeat protein (TIGR03943 family)